MNECNNLWYTCNFFNFQPREILDIIYINYKLLNYINIIHKSANTLLSNQNVPKHRLHLQQPGKIKNYNKWNGKNVVYAPEFTFSPRHRHKPAKLVSACENVICSYLETNTSRRQILLGDKYSRRLLNFILIVLVLSSIFLLW